MYISLIPESYLVPLCSQAPSAPCATGNHRYVFGHYLFCQVFDLHTVFLVQNHLLSVFSPSWPSVHRAWKLISFSFLLFQNAHCMPLSFSSDTIISSFSFICIHYRLWPQVIAQGVSMSKSFHLQISVILFLRPIRRNRRNLPNYSFVNSFILVIFFMAST